MLNVVSNSVAYTLYSGSRALRAFQGVDPQGGESVSDYWSGMVAVGSTVYGVPFSAEPFLAVHACDSSHTVPREVRRGIFPRLLG